MNVKERFNQALIDIANATDGSGRRVCLLAYIGLPTVSEIKRALRHLYSGTGSSAVFLPVDGDGELACARNIELLARAWQAAILYYKEFPNGH